MRTDLPCDMNELMFKGYVCGVITKALKDRERTVKWLANHTDIPPSSLYTKLKTGKFSLYEISKIMLILEVDLNKLKEYFL